MPPTPSPRSPRKIRRDIKLDAVNEAPVSPEKDEQQHPSTSTHASTAAPHPFYYPNPAYGPPPYTPSPPMTPQPPMFMYPPVMPLYGHVQQHQGATYVYTNGYIPANTPVILVPMHTVMASVPPPMPPPVVPQSAPSTVHSVGSDSGFIDYNHPFLVVIERNVFKNWFDSNVPEVMRGVRMKKYKSIESFTHWTMAKKKFHQFKIFILIRVTDVRNLLNEVINRIPGASRVVKGIYAYEHLFSGEPGKSLKAISDSIREDPRVQVSEKLEEACSFAVSALENYSSPSNTAIHLSQ
jgi:hypothetical protein